MNIVFAMSLVRMLRIIIGFYLLYAMLLHADQEMETLVSFTGDNGMLPGALVQTPNGDFYGTTLLGGKNNLGTIFKMAPDKELETAVTFDGKNGASPSSRLIVMEDGSVYGTTKEGGANNLGTIFKILPDGSMQTIASLIDDDPQPDIVVEPDGTIYGCTDHGGTSNKGTLFKIGPDHQLVTLASFTEQEGEYPQGLFESRDGKLHGVTCSGGGCGSGSVFTADKSGHISILCNFSVEGAAAQHSRMVEASDGSFFGTSFNGGKDGFGEVYSISPQGVMTHYPGFAKWTGYHPGPDLVEWNNGYFYMVQLYRNIMIKSSDVQWSGVNFCGTTVDGGLDGNGTVFRITADGRITTILSFSGMKGKNPGSSPSSLIPGADGSLYGTTATGGLHDKGTIFRLHIPHWPEKSASDHRLPILASLPIVSH